MIKILPLFLYFLSFLLILNFTFADDNNLFQTKQQLNYSKLPVEVALCEGSASAFFVSDNINIQDNIKPSSIIRGINEQQCIEYCKNNRDQNGRTLLCSLLIYRSEVQECRLFRRTTFPDGESFRQSLEGYRLIEKFCLSEDISMECANKQFIRVDNYILRGYAQSTITVPTLAECVNECMKEKEFNCLSAMYFYEEGECITNTESAITAPDDFQPPEEDDQKVVFFHNACSRSGGGGGGESSVNGNDRQLELAQSQDSAITTSALIQDETTTQDLNSSSSIISSSPSTTSLSLDTTITEENKNNNLFIQENNKNEEQNNNILINEINTKTTNKILEEKEQQKEENKLNKQNSENKKQLLINSSSVFVLQEEENNQKEKEEKPLNLPKVYLPQKEEENINENKDNNNNLIIQQQQQRQYGAKTIERASDGSFQEKILINSSDDLLPISSSSSPTLLNNNNPIKSTNFNRKGPESTKRLHLKLIKDQRPKPDINNIILPPSPTTTTTNLPPKINKLIPKYINDIPHALPSIYSSSPSIIPSTNLFTTLPSTTIKELKENIQKQPEFVPLELSEPLNEHSAEERFEGSEGYFSLWGPWTPCNIPGERRIRRRKCLDLRKCRGSLTQVDYCQTNKEIDEEQQNNEKQNNDLLPPSLPSTNINENFNNKNNDGEEPKPPGITPPPSHEIVLMENLIEKQKQFLNKKEKQFGTITSKTENEIEIWSAWNGTCQHFASSQPCKDGQVIGFESRECIAKDPLLCKGPFFRYCTLPC
uniref:Apple domain-containing protein n=1 Tax=Meloidogyne hapla TaxID=6305 RepID=A0A1I8B5R6_MELHA